MYSKNEKISGYKRENLGIEALSLYGWGFPFVTALKFSINSLYVWIEYLSSVN